MGSLFSGSSGTSGTTTSARPSSLFNAAPTAAPQDIATGEQPYTDKAAVNKKSLAETLQRLHAAGDSDSFNKLVTQYGNVFTPDEVKYYGLDSYGKNGDSGKSKSWTDRFKENTGKVFKLGDSATGGALSAGLSDLDYGRAAGVGLIRQAHAGLSRGLDALPGVQVAGADKTKYGWDQFKQDVSSHEGFGQLWNETKQGAAAEGDNTLFGSKALNDNKWVDRGVGLVGDIAADPLTHLSFTASPLAKATMKTIAEEMGQDVARKIGTYGLEGALKKGAIDEVTAEAVRNTVRRSVEDTVSSAAKKRSIRKLVEEQGSEGAAQSLTDRAMKEVAESGRSGLRAKLPLGMGERTVLPSHPFGVSLPGWDKFAWQTSAGRATEAATAAERAAGGAAEHGAAETVPSITPEEMSAQLTVLDHTAKTAGTTAVADGVEKIEQTANDFGPPATHYVTRNAAGDVTSFLSMTREGEQEFVEALYKKPGEAAGASKKLYAAAEADGWDISRAGARGMTEEGRAARAAFLRTPRDVPTWQAGDVIPHGDSQFDVLGRSEDGKDIFARIADDNALIEFKRNPKRMTLKDSVATGGERNGRVPYGEIRRGDRIPGVGLVRSVDDDGVFRLFVEDKPLPAGYKERSLFPPKALQSAQEAAGGPASARLSGGASSAPIRKGLGSALRGTKPAQVLREAFIPRAKIIDALGATTAQKVYQAVEQASAYAGTNVNDMMLRIGKITDSAIKDLAKGPGDALLEAVPELAGKIGNGAWNDIALGVLEGTIENVDQVTAALRTDGMENAARATETYLDVASHTEEALATAKGATNDASTLLPETRSRLPRILTSEGAQIAKGEGQQRISSLFGIAPKELRAGADLSHYVDQLSPEVDRLTANAQGGISQTLGQDTAALAGKTYAELPVKQLNADMVKRLNLPEGTKLFEDDAMTAVALRGKSAFEAAAQTDIVERLAKETYDGTNAMATIVRPTDSALTVAKKMEQVEANGWKELEGHKSALGRVYGPPEIMNELSKVNDVILNDESLRRMQEFLQKWNGVWASYATVPLVFGPGFHTRNSLGNQILAFMGGMTNPARIGEAINVQWSYGRTRALMKKEGLSFEAALERQVENPRTRQLIKDMRQHGILSNGFFADISSSEVDNVLRHNSMKDWLHASKYPARIADNKMIRSGRHLGDIVENNARVALYLDAYGKMGTVQAAADHVKKYLFDYGDLTPFERRNMKSLNRFYTFTRKNIAVQLDTLAKDPWRVKLPAQLESNAYQGNDSSPLPDYAKQSGFNMAGFLGKPQGTEGVAMNIDTPLDNMIRSLDPIAQAVTLIPGIRQLVPEQYRSNLGDTARATINLRAGGPVELVNFLVEEATGKDLFSGKDISKESGADTLKRFSSVIAPLYAKGANFQGSPVNPVKIVTGGFGEDPAHPGMNTRLALLQSVVGFQMLPITDKQANQMAYVGAQEAQNAITKLKAEGIDVPSYTDLVAVGLAPDLRAPTDPNAKRRSPKEAAQAKVDSVNAARAATGAEPLTIKPTVGKSSKKSSGSLFG